MDKIFVTLTAAQQVICDACGRPGCPRLWGCGCDRIDRLIAISAADVRPVVRGHWIEHISDLFPADSTIECDQCHAEQPTGIDDNFCPNCGADMREPNLDTTKGDNHD